MKNSKFATTNPNKLTKMETLRQQLTDLPRWVETRDLLNRSECELISSDDDTDLAFVVFDDDDEFGSVVGMADSGAIQRAAQECDELLAFPDNIDHVVSALPHWKAEEVSVHLAENFSVFPPPPSNCRLLGAGELATFKYLEKALAEELLDVEEDDRPIAAAFDDKVAVAFCYPTCNSESYWDVSIDTIPTHRRRGFAQQASLAMIDYQRKRMLQPVWCAVESNTGSLQLAHKLGFQPVDKIWLLSVGD